ncbi:MAG: hypothetical protein OEZ43_14030 [Gammaproteobacteria bacterium]|nr:hypothetical protein [Gammaproteobacteria bacterium]
MTKKYKIEAVKQGTNSSKKARQMIMGEMQNTFMADPESLIFQPVTEMMITVEGRIKLFVLLDFDPN